MAEEPPEQPQQPEQIRLMHQLVAMSAQRTRMSAERCYQNTERTLSNWIRTALALMVFGMAIDRFSLLISRLPGKPPGSLVHSNDLSSWCGLALVSFGVLMSVVTGLRFVRYAWAYERSYKLPARHGPYLATFFALAVSVFGLALLAVMFTFTT
ncbi:YidH family protein [Salinisphaera sp. RV14]|uniref:YidH family protein n=1 Tax=Salinisphaera sp. RV14 TaxID=3454140 RepID=UPI003F8326BD